MSPRIRALPFLALALACSVAGAALAEDPVFTWVDSSGVRHYAQTAPEGVKYEIRGIRDQQVGTQGVEAVARAAPNAGEQQACERAQLSLAQLQAAGPLEMDRDGDGTLEPLTLEDRATQQRLAEQAVRAYCAPASN